MPPAPVPTPGVPPALSAFLKGVGARALLFADLHSPPGEASHEALASALRRFVAEADGLPMARWPARFWQRVLAELPKREPGPGPAGAPAAGEAWPGFERLPPLGTGARAAMLLALVAGLDEDDGGAALGVDAATWRLALRRAAPHDAEGRFDEAAWRGLAAAVREAQRALPGARLEGWTRTCDAALAARAAPPGHVAAIDADAGADPGNARRRKLVRLLWAAVGACALALAATFLPWHAWRGGSAGADANAGAPVAAGVPLRKSGAPRARYDEAFALRHHPDLPLLLADADARLRGLDLSSWYAARLAREAAATPASAAGFVPAAPPEAPFAAVAFDALPPARVAALRERAAAWDRLPHAERGALRERWLAWQRLTPAQRGAVRAAGDAFAILPAETQAALRAEFDAQALDLQRGWLLGPVLGARWAQLEPLLMQVPDGEREPLIARLQAMDAAELEALAVLAQRTPPQSRDALRRRLLGGVASGGQASR